MDSLMNFVRTKVALEKKRFKDGTIELDLTYVTGRIIAMGFPSSGVEATYRNDINDVAAFLKARHSGKFLIWNLSARQYDYGKFDNQVLEFGFPDEYAPPLELLFKMCRSMHSWLGADPANIAVVHCQTGKSRTGLLVACYLCYSGQFDTGPEALQFFSSKRTVLDKGLSVPSQRRYLAYLTEVVRSHKEPSCKPLVLQRIVMNTVPHFDRASGCRPFMQIFRNSGTMPIFSSVTGGGTAVRSYQPKDGSIIFPVDIIIQGNVLIKFQHLAAITAPPMFRFSFHTGFVDYGVLRLTKLQLDGSQDNKRFDDDFFIDLMFGPLKGDLSKRAKRELEREELQWRDIVASLPRHSSKSPVKGIAHAGSSELKQSSLAGKPAPQEPAPVAPQYEIGCVSPHYEIGAGDDEGADLSPASASHSLWYPNPPPSVSTAITSTDSELELKAGSSSASAATESPRTVVVPPPAETNELLPSSDREGTLLSASSSDFGGWPTSPQPATGDVDVAAAPDSVSLAAAPPAYGANAAEHIDEFDAFLEMTSPPSQSQSLEAPVGDSGSLRRGSPAPHLDLSLTVSEPAALSSNAAASVSTLGGVANADAEMDTLNSFLSGTPPPVNADLPLFTPKSLHTFEDFLAGRPVLPSSDAISPGGPAADVPPMVALTDSVPRPPAAIDFDAWLDGDSAPPGSGQGATSEVSLDAPGPSTAPAAAPAFTIGDDEW